MVHELVLDGCQLGVDADGYFQFFGRRRPWSDAAGDRLGERVAADVLPMRIVLICKADVALRRIKIGRGKNKHDAWLPEDLEICGGAFHMMRAAVNESAAHPMWMAKISMWMAQQPM